MFCISHSWLFETQNALRHSDLKMGVSRVKENGFTVELVNSSWEFTFLFHFVFLYFYLCRTQLSLKPIFIL